MGITVEEVLKAIENLDKETIKYYLICSGASERKKVLVAELVRKLQQELKNG